MALSSCMWSTKYATWLENYGVKEINFYDDLFCCDLNRIREMIRLLREQGMLGKVKVCWGWRTWLMTTTISLLKERLLRNWGGLEWIGRDPGISRKGSNINVKGNSIEIIRRHGIGSIAVLSSARHLKRKRYFGNPAFH